MNKILIYIIFIVQLFLAKSTKIIIKIFAAFEVKGVENLYQIDTGMPVIFASNHASEVDPLIIGAALSKNELPIFFITQPMHKYDWRGWRKILYNNRFMNLLGSVSVETGTRDYEISLKKHKKILDEQRSNICIFPEGRRSPDGKIQNARGGVSFLSYRTKTPVIPIGISGVFRISFKKLLLGRLKIIVNIGEPIRVEKMLPEEREPTIDEFKYVSYQIMFHRIQPLVNLPAAPELTENALGSYNQ